MRQDEIKNEINSLFDRVILNFKEHTKHEKFTIDRIKFFELYGKVVSARGVSITANIKDVKIGDLCVVEDERHSLEIISEVVAIDNDNITLLPFESISGLSVDCTVKKISDGFTMNVGDHLLGKVINGFGLVSGNINGDLLDSKKANHSYECSIYAYAPDPMTRPVIDTPFYTGVKSIDGFITCGRGQRIGIFAGPGMGKTTLMGMIIRNSEADVIVIGLIGERGREVKEFIEIELTGFDVSKCILVVATSDRPPIEQLKCAYVAQTICEYFRAKGKNVLLFVDSITRFARAGREVGLSSGESISRGGYPPSVFASFPKLMERAGVDENGSITAFYTVLMEGEELNKDAIADEVKSIIDGHIILSRKLVEQSHFPAIDVLSSLSRVGDRLISDEHINAMRHLRLLLSKYKEIEFLLRIGEYKKGEDNIADKAVDNNQKIMKLLTQKSTVPCQFDETVAEMVSIAGI
ncbi:MAG: FliI/YscN family ATPase [Burkholderiales bacterium]|nr:FliI/YscN family ATPase [Burkholderiales bacterium]